MIFVTVGSSSLHFNRLIKEMDRIAGEIDEKIIMQIGNSRSVYYPKNTEYYSFIPKEKILDFFKNSRIIVSHAGVGTILTALKYDSCLIIVPRREKFEENFSDHQVDIARVLKEEDKIRVVYDIKSLQNELNYFQRRSRSKTKKNISSDKENLILKLKNYIKDIDK